MKYKYLILAILIFIGCKEKKAPVFSDGALTKEDKETIACFEKLPPGYRLLSNGKDYCIQYNVDGHYWFIQDSRFGGYLAYSANSTFKDSCDAKKLAMEHWQTILESRKDADYKPIN